MQIKFLSKTFLIIAVIIGILIFFTYTIENKTASHNDISRLAAIIAVSRYNQFSIDETIQVDYTVDKVIYNNQFYSSKPPLMSVAGGYITKIFFSLKPVLLNNDVAIYKFNTFIFVTLPIVILFLSFLYLISDQFKKVTFIQYFFALFLIFGTLIFTYSTNLNNHILIAAIQLIVFILIFKNLVKNDFLNILLVGLFSGMILSLDLTYAIAVVPISYLMLLFQYKTKIISATIFFILGCLPFTIIHFYLNYMQFNIFLPPQLFPSIYLNYKDSNWINNNWGIESQSSPRHIVTFNYLFGTYGLFLYQPVLLLGFFFKKNYVNKEFLYTLAILISILIFNIVTSPNYGGSSFGPRRLIPIIPLLFYFSYKYILHYWHKSVIQKCIIIFMLFLTLSFSWIGYANPWSNYNVYGKKSERLLYFPLLFSSRDLLDEIGQEKLIDKLIK